MSDPRPAPYPADTRAKGWRFELNMEQVKKSDTWLRARTGYVRAHLLLLWSEAWEQTPCGSLPDDDELLALLLDMEPDEFAAHRGVLMRGWWKAEDGRLYHDTIADRVIEMLARKDGERQRKAAWRARQSAGVPQDTTVTAHGLTEKSRATDDTGTGTGTTQQDKPVGGAKRASRKCPRPFEVTAEMRAWAAEKTPGINLDGETEKFLDNTFKVAISDWQGAWRNWMRKAVEFSGQRAAPGVPGFTVPSAEADKTAAYLAEQARQAEAAKSPEAQAARLALVNKVHGKAAA